MKNTKNLIAGALLVGLPTFAIAQDPAPYIGILGSHVHSDKARQLEDGPGGHLLIGLPFSEHWAAELNLFAHRGDHDYDGGADKAYGAGLDLRATLGPSDWRIAPFLLAGGGAQNDDIPGSNETAGYANLGGGLLWRLGGARSSALRLEARRVAEFTDEIDPAHDRLYDTRISVGAEFALAAAPQPAPASAPEPAAAPADSDGDGVLDNADLCPGTPSGTRVDARGCALPPAPVKDSDGDGVPDTADACPDTSRGLKVDSRGCAVKAQVLVLRDINFEFDSSTLTADARSILNGIVAGLRGQPTMEVRIEGHTDSTGSEAYNLELSRKRAQAVRTYLTEQGIEGRRLQSEGHGESRPEASNATREGRAQNRRVEFHVLTE